MISISPSSPDLTAAAPCAAGEHAGLRSMTGWRMDSDSGIDGAKRAMAGEGVVLPNVVAEGKRAGARGKGSKPARTRSTAEFSEGFDTVSSDRSYARANRKSKKAQKLEEDRASGRLDEMRAELVAAKAAVLAGTATREQMQLDMQADDREFFMKLYATDQTSWERIVTVGYVHPGGMVNGRWRAPFVQKGLKSWEHPYFQRFVASTGSAKSKNLRTGPSKSECTIQFKKLPALDQPQAFFSVACRDMWRLDCEKPFKTQAHLRAWIAEQVIEHDLPCGPHIIANSPDDRFPGEWNRPHLYFILPEGSAVWKESDPQQHAMLGQVIAGLTLAFECDPGGLADPFSGKNVVSPLVDAEIYQDTHMPTLIEYFEALGCTLDPKQMVRFMSAQALEEAGFDKADSNTWFTTVARLSNLCAQDLHRQGFPTADAARLKKRIIKAITPAALEAIQPSGEQRKAVASLIACCARYAATTFDPDKMDTSGKDLGAAAHLIEATDSKHVKQSKGGTYAATVRITETRAIITKAILLELAAGREPTIASLTAIVPRCYNSVKRHFFACYQTVKATLALKSVLRGHANLPGISLPSQAVLLTANSPSDLPSSWSEALRDPVIVDHFRLQALRRARKRSVSVPIPGQRVIDFLSAGPVTVYRRAAVVSQAA